MKDWQLGYELDYLKSLEKFFEPHNIHTLSPFAKFKKNNIAEALHKGTLHLEWVGAAYVEERAKVNGKIRMLPGVVIGEKLKGDVTLTCLCGDSLNLLDALKQYHDQNCWLTTFAGNQQICDIAARSGFKYVGYKVTSFAEVLAIYFRDAHNSFADRVHPIVSPVEHVSMAKVCDVDKGLLDTIRMKLQSLPLNYTNHYSNYNTKKAWSALALRGYSADPAFITKPAEMNNKWLEEHKDECFALQDTPLYDQFPEVRELLSFLDGEVHRVRFMRLAPGGGELNRHTDQVDVDAGNSPGALARFHLPLKTNKDVIFTTWNGNDQEERYHYGFGECWVIDTRKPHMAVNGGDEERIHLVVDVVVTPKIQQMITEGVSTQV